MKNVEEKKHIPVFPERRDVICLITGIIAGFVTHFYMLANKITNLDDIVCVPDVGGGAVLGRYLQMPVHMLFSEWSAPAINGSMSILLLSITCCVLLHLLGIRSDSGAVLVPLLVLTGPSVASNMYYMYLSPTFSFAILLSVCAVAVTLGSPPGVNRIFMRFGWIAGVVLLIISTACYQAYFALSATVFLLVLLTYLIDDTGSNVIMSGLKALLVLILAMAGYLISLKVLRIDMYDYKGMSNIGQATFKARINSLLRTWHRVLQYFVTDPESFNEGPPIVIMRLLSVCLILSVIAVVYLRLRKAGAVKLVLFFVILFLLPPAMALTYIMAPEVDHATTVMTFSYIGFDLLSVSLLERVGQDRRHAGVSFVLSALMISTTLLLIARSYADYRLVNNAYYRSYLAQTRMLSYYERLLIRLENEGYKAGEPLMIVGDYDPEPLPAQQVNMGAEMFEDFEGMTLESHLFLPTIRNYMLRRFFGMDIRVYDLDDIRKMESRKEIEVLPSYPDNGCVTCVDGTWVIKVGK